MNNTFTSIQNFFLPYLLLVVMMVGITIPAFSQTDSILATPIDSLLGVDDPTITPQPDSTQFGGSIDDIYTVFNRTTIELKKGTLIPDPVLPDSIGIPDYLK